MRFCRVTLVSVTEIDIMNYDTIEFINSLSRPEHNYLQI